jgi:hypothetical protein
LREALNKGEPLPVQPLERPGGDKSLRARLVPAPATRPGFLAHPRLRRTSPITHYAAAAALDAVAGLRARRLKKSGWAWWSASRPVACITPAVFLMKS